MSADYLSERQKALVDLIYFEKDKKLLEKLKEQQAAAKTKEAISQATGISDEQVLAELTALGLAPETLAALYLVPLVETAWADGAVDQREREATLAGAVEQGLQKGGHAYQLLERWLDERPGDAHLQAWKSYVSALCRSLDGEARERLRGDVLRRAKAVAEAAGGILGMGNRVSAAEQAILDDLQKAFD